MTEKCLLRIMQKKLRKDFNQGFAQVAIGTLLKFNYSFASQ